ncbi:MAG: YfiR family protein [Bryobacteraceae bacterium]|nr:YfiR family protein [Bryobacteraceae bacterium]
MLIHGGPAVGTYAEGRNLSRRRVASFCFGRRSTGLRTLLIFAMHAALRGTLSATLPPKELELKAVYVLNFIRLVKWVEIPGENVTKLPVCALAKSDFATTVGETVTGKTVGNRVISFRLTPSPDPLLCRVVIVDTASYPVAQPALHAVRDAPVLTIGNGPGLLAMGGMFELIVEDRKVQFDASLDAVRRAKLDVSARLLQLSRNLRKGSGSAL